MRISRRFTAPEKDIWADIPFRTLWLTGEGDEDMSLFGADALPVEEAAETGFEVPSRWPRAAVDALVHQVMIRSGIPAARKAVPEDGVPQWLQLQVADERALLEMPARQRRTGETSARQVFTRIARAWTRDGWKAGLFEDEEAARAFCDEIIWMLAHRMISPGAGQWRLTGAFMAYGIDMRPGIDQVIGGLDDPAREADLLAAGGVDMTGRLLSLADKGAAVNLSALGDEANTPPVMELLSLLDRAGAIRARDRNGPAGRQRRRSQLAILDITHAEAEAFAGWKLEEEQKAAAIMAGSRAASEKLNRIMRAAFDGSADPDQPDTDPATNLVLARAVQAAREAMVPDAFIRRALQFAGQGFRVMRFRTHNEDWDSGAFTTVGGQHTDIALRVDDDWMEAATKGAPDPGARREGALTGSLRARNQFEDIATSVWSTGAPSLIFCDAVSAMAPTGADDPVRTASTDLSCHFADDTGLVSGTLNLAAFITPGGGFDHRGFAHATRLLVIALDAGLAGLECPGARITRRTQAFRPLAIGWSNLAPALMMAGLAWDSQAARAFAAGITTLMTGTAWSTSADLAGGLRIAEGLRERKGALAGIVRHARDAVCDGLLEGCQDQLLAASAQLAIEEAAEKVAAMGARNASVTALAGPGLSDPGGVVDALMDVAAPGISPARGILRFERDDDGSFARQIRPEVPLALKALGYSSRQIDAIINHVLGHGTLENAPAINHAALREKGFTTGALLALEEALDDAFDIRFVFNRWTLGDEFCTGVLGLDEAALDDFGFDMLAALGFSEDEIARANAWACGAMALEGAPGLRGEHLAIFDGENTAAAGGQLRRIQPEAEIRMMAAVQPVLSGGIARTVTLPHETTVAEVARLIRLAHMCGLKSLTLYREGARLAEPVADALLGGAGALADQRGTSAVDRLMRMPDAARTPMMAGRMLEQMIGRNAEALKGLREPLPDRRKGYSQSAMIGGHEVSLRTGEYEDGRVAELFIDMADGGHAVRSLLNHFAAAISTGLQYGVPLDAFVDSFVGTRFPPAGKVEGNAAFEQVSSILDYVFRELGLSYLGREDLAGDTQEKPATGTALTHDPAVTIDAAELAPAGRPDIEIVDSLDALENAGQTDAPVQASGPEIRRATLESLREIARDLGAEEAGPEPAGRNKGSSAA